MGVEPWKEHPVNEGKNCIKGRNAFDFLYADGRLTKPLVKENGSFQEASWEKALGLIADKLMSTMELVAKRAHTFDVGTKGLTSTATC